MTYRWSPAEDLGSEEEEEQRDEEAWEEEEREEEEEDQDECMFAFFLWNASLFYCGRVSGCIVGPDVCYPISCLLAHTSHISGHLILFLHKSPGPLTAEGEGVIESQEATRELEAEEKEEEEEELSQPGRMFWRRLCFKIPLCLRIVALLRPPTIYRCPRYSR